MEVVSFSLSICFRFRLKRSLFKDVLITIEPTVFSELTFFFKAIITGIVFSRILLVIEDT